MNPDPILLEELGGIGRGIRVYAGALLLRPLSIFLDDDVRIDKDARIEGGQFTWIGQDTHISSFASILGGGECIIGQHCAIAQGVKIITGVGHPNYLAFPKVPPGDDPMHITRGKVVIGDYVLIGVNTVIYPDVNIGEGAVIDTLCKIAKDIPPWSIVTGTPARVIGQRRNWMKKKKPHETA